MRWDEGLTPEQRVAAAHEGGHAVLIAGPGTGKTHTLTRRIIKLCQTGGVAPGEILAVTFTRAAAALLRSKVAKALGEDNELPTACTLHSYALSQLILSGEIITILPQPLRIADDWEGRQIILEDLKHVLGLDIKEVRERFDRLSADWQTLNREANDWENTFPDPRFLGAWLQHRALYGYSVRDELVYQLKQAIDRIEGFRLPHRPRHLFVDEYQDLNPCDLAVVHAICDQGAELFAAGDDDQSIYGFREAFPQGIRRFAKSYPDSKRLDLNDCQRCEQSILDVAHFVADLDPNRLPKNTRSVCPPVCGEVNLLSFDHGAIEADIVARICKRLVQDGGQDPGEILILIRSDKNHRFSDPLAQSLRTHGLPVAVKVETDRPTDGRNGRMLLAFMRLVVAVTDSLSWRTLMRLRYNHVGRKSFEAIHLSARAQQTSFVGALQRIRQNPEIVPSLGGRIAAEVVSIQQLVDEAPPHPGEDGTAELVEWVGKLSKLVIAEENDRKDVVSFIQNTAESFGCQAVPELLRALSLSEESIEQERDADSINIMTMHKAKGLSADVVFIIAAEDEYVPGKAENGPLENDELRLLYVSMTRARHRLYLTHCRERRGGQRHSGRTAGQRRRTLTRFLRYGPLRSIPGATYLRAM